MLEQENKHQSRGLSALLTRKHSPDSLRPVSPNINAYQHNHRRITQLQQLHLATGVSNRAQTKNSDKTAIHPLHEDRTTLELFFYSTHQSDSDWTNPNSGGSGRSNWLDRGKEIDKWQGITVGDSTNTRDSIDFGRVVKLQLPKNSINGKKLCCNECVIIYPAS